jgi:hypothetical protein
MWDFLQNKEIKLKIVEEKIVNLSKVCVCVTYFIILIGINVIVHTGVKTSSFLCCVLTS